MKVFEFNLIHVIGKDTKKKEAEFNEQNLCSTL